MEKLIDEMIEAFDLGDYEKANQLLEKILD